MYKIGQPGTKTLHDVGQRAGTLGVSFNVILQATTGMPAYLALSYYLGWLSTVEQHKQLGGTR